MIKRIHFDDDLFFLQTMIKNIKDGLSLEIDLDYYADKIVEDIFFIDAILEKIFSALRENETLIRRTEYLKILSRTKKYFIEFLRILISKEIPLSVFFEPFSNKFSAIQAQHKKGLQEINELLDVLENNLNENQDMISQEEFKFLFIFEE